VDRVLLAPGAPREVRLDVRRQAGGVSDGTLLLDVYGPGLDGHPTRVRG
jgi:hypothetical protein